MVSVTNLLVQITQCLCCHWWVMPTHKGVFFNQMCTIFEYFHVYLVGRLAVCGYQVWEGDDGELEVGCREDYVVTKALSKCEHSDLYRTAITKYFKGKPGEMYMYVFGVIRVKSRCIDSIFECFFGILLIYLLKEVCKLCVGQS